MQPYQLYGMGSPNVVKVAIALEELDQAYELRWVNVFKGQQHEAAIRALTLNGKVPVLVEPRDERDFALFESAAIMEYLAEKHGNFAGNSPDERAIVRQWLYFQMAGVGPMFGQAIHFSFVTKECPYGRDRFTIEMRRLLVVVEARLSEAKFLAGEYSIADMALWPWIRTLKGFFPDDLQGPALGKWYDTIEARPAVAAAVERMAQIQKDDRQSMKTASKDQLDRYFGRSAN